MSNAASVVPLTALQEIVARLRDHSRTMLVNAHCLADEIEAAVAAAQAGAEPVAWQHRCPKAHNPRAREWTACSRELFDNHPDYNEHWEWRELFASPVAQGWQPIATAPKDGARFLAYWKGSFGVPMIAVTSYDGKPPRKDQEPPTHWMPLPEPPR